MRTIQGGPLQKVDWYFTPPGINGPWRHHIFGTLNYQRPNPPVGSIGEDASTRVWRDGSIPSYVGPVLGSSSQGPDAAWLAGRPTAPLVPQPIDFMGRQTFPFGGTPGTFPPHPAVTNITVALHTNAGYAINLVTAQTNLYGFLTSGRPGREVQLLWYHPPVPKFTCYPNTWALVYDSAGDTGQFLRCVADAEPSHVSVWDDGGLGTLQPGEQLVLSWT